MEMKRLSKCLETGQEMVRLAKADEWDQVENLQKEWEALLYASFEPVGLDTTEKSSKEVGLIKALLSVNKEIISLVRLRSQFLSKEITTFSIGRKAVRAYQE